MAAKKFCHDLRLVSWGTVMHEMITLMNPPECEKMLFYNVDINASFYCYIFRKKVQTSPDQIPTKISLTITLTGCFMVSIVNFGSYRDALLGGRTIFGNPLTSVKVLSSPNITFSILQLSNVDISGKS